MATEVETEPQIASTEDQKLYEFGLFEIRRDFLHRENEFRYSHKRHAVERESNSTFSCFFLHATHFGGLLDPKRSPFCVALCSRLNQRFLLCLVSHYYQSSLRETSDSLIREPIYLRNQISQLKEELSIERANNQVRFFSVDSRSFSFRFSRLLRI